MRLIKIKCLKCGHVWKLNMTLRSIFHDLNGIIICQGCNRAIRILEDKLLDCVKEKSE